MKRLLSLCLLFIFFTKLVGQDVTNMSLYPINENTERIEFLKVVEDIPLDKEQLFSNAQTWVANTFGDYKKVLQFEDKDAGRLIIKGNFKLDEKIVSTPKEILTYPSFYHFILTIDCKDNKYRYKITDFEVTSTFLNHTSKLEIILKVRDNYKLKTLVELENIDLSKLNKKELEKHINQLDVCKMKIEVGGNMSLEELQTIDNLTRSLERTMSTNDDF